MTGFTIIGAAKCFTRDYEAASPEFVFWIYRDNRTGDEVCSSCGVVCSNWQYTAYWG